MAEFATIIDDDVAAGDDIERVLEAQRSSDDAVALDADVVLAERASFADVIVSDDVAVADTLVKVTVEVEAFSDTMVVVDLLTISLNQAIDLSDAVGVADTLSSQPTIAFTIDEARALTEMKVRIDFVFPALVNGALTKPSSYVFNNLSPGAVEVTPLSVTLPSGQPNPLYVEIVTTEHTNGGTYEVALVPAIRGAAGEIGHTVPFAYIAIGTAPTLQLVIAKSATEVEVHFNEAIENNTAARSRDNYIWAGGISTIDVRSVEGAVVVLQTTPQTPGQLYTLTVLGTVPGQDYDIELFTDEPDAEDELTAVLSG